MMGPSGETGRDGVDDRAAESPVSTLAGLSAGAAPRRGVPALIDLLQKAMRARRLYADNNQAYRHFASAVRAAIGALWDAYERIDLRVEKNAFVWEDQRIRAGGEHGGLSFLFYKDGIRRLTFLPGFEDEVEGFLVVLDRAQGDRRQEEDLVTLLWEQDFDCFHYVYVDVLAEGLTLPDLEPEPLDEIGREAIDADLGAAEPEDGEEAAEPAESAAAPAARQVSPDDFQETLYVLDESELRELRAQAGEEWERDVKAAVLDALFDRLEDRAARPGRRLEIVQALHHSLADSLSARRFEDAARILDTLEAFAESDVELGEEERTALDELFGALAEPKLLAGLIEAMDEGRVDPEAESLAKFFGHLPADALPVLLRAVVAVGRAAVQDRLLDVVGRLAARHPDRLLGLLDEDDAAVVRGAARLAGWLRLREAVPRLRRVLRARGALTELRVAAVEALVGIRSADALEALQAALDDADRSVRIAAARGLGSLGYKPASARFERVLKRRSFRKVDLAEKVAFFRAYGTLGGAGAVELLDEMLNGRKLLRGRQPPEIRAGAALALGTIALPTARAALRRASGASNPAVRAAVRRALSDAEPDGTT